jgi:hypothetical protein
MKDAGIDVHWHGRQARQEHRQQEMPPSLQERSRPEDSDRKAEEKDGRHVDPGIARSSCMAGTKIIPARPPHLCITPPKDPT